VLEQLERQVREHRDQARRLELDRDGASREHLDTQNRREALEIERQQLADALDVTERELITAREQVAKRRIVLNNQYDWSGHTRSRTT
jgi:chromosome segregation protein